MASGLGSHWVNESPTVFHLNDRPTLIRYIIDMSILFFNKCVCVCACVYIYIYIYIYIIYIYNIDNVGVYTISRSFVLLIYRSL